MTNTEGVKPVEVIQADRDAAANFLEQWEPGPEMTVVKLARAFARHRLTHQPPAASARISAGDKDRENPVERSGIYQPNTSAQPVAWVIPGRDNASVDGWIDARAERGGEFTRPLYAQPASQPVEEPFGYWIEHTLAEPTLLRKPAYIPQPTRYQTVTPLYTQLVWDVDRSFEALKQAINTDPEYAWGWQCNLAVPIMDVTGASHAAANQAAALILQQMFGCDITSHPHYGGEKSLEQVYFQARVEAERTGDAALSQHPDPQPQADVVELLENAEGAAQWLDQMADRFEGEWPNTAKHCRIHVNSLRHAIAALSQHPDPQARVDAIEQGKHGEMG